MMTMAFSQFYFYFVLSISSSLLLMMMMMMNLVFAGPTGLTLKLIHIDSPESPLYPGNLTQEERIHRDVQRSEARFQQLTTSIKSWRVRNNNNSSSSSSSSSKSHPDLVMRPPVFFDGAHYLAQVGIGTFGQKTFKTYFVMIDSGSRICWLQCEGCKPCFPQVGEAYPATDSSTYNKIPCNEDPWPLHPLCTPGLCDPDGFCEYQVLYGDRSYTRGVLATEKLTVNVDMHGVEPIYNFVFGCGLEQKDFKTGHGQAEVELGGILGLGGGDYSFLQQLGDRGKMKFSYCFQLWRDKWASKSNTYLRFGSDADHIGGAVVQTTPFYYGRGDTIYYVSLNDISIGESPVGYPRGAFDLRPLTGTGGCAFDSGTPLTLIAPALYVIFQNHLIQYFAALDIHTADESSGLTCFTKRDGFTDYPSITFHFKDADFEIEPEAAFLIGDQIFCSVILRYNAAPGAEPIALAVMFGAIQQANHRVLYDVDNQKISWSKEQCVSPL